MNHKTIFLCTALALAFALSLFGCGGAPASQPSGGGAAYRQITPDQAHELMQAGEVTVVDVRRADEYEAGHIPGAVLVPQESIGQQMPDALPDADATLLVYCRSGRRSKLAAQQLADLGYTDVREFGGIIDWNYDITEGAEP